MDKSRILSKEEEKWLKLGEEVSKLRSDDFENQFLTEEGVIGDILNNLVKNIQKLQSRLQSAPNFSFLKYSPVSIASILTGLTNSGIQRYLKVMKKETKEDFQLECSSRISSIDEQLKTMIDTLQWSEPMPKANSQLSEVLEKNFANWRKIFTTRFRTSPYSENQALHPTLSAQQFEWQKIGEEVSKLKYNSFHSVASIPTDFDSVTDVCCNLINKFCQLQKSLPSMPTYSFFKLQPITMCSIFTGLPTFEIEKKLKIRGGNPVDVCLDTILLHKVKQLDSQLKEIIQQLKTTDKVPKAKKYFHEMINANGLLLKNVKAEVVGESTSSWCPPPPKLRSVLPPHAVERQQLKTTHNLTIGEQVSNLRNGTFQASSSGSLGTARSVEPTIVQNEQNRKLGEQVSAITGRSFPVTPIISITTTELPIMVHNMVNSFKILQTLIPSAPNQSLFKYSATSICAVFTGLPLSMVQEQLRIKENANRNGYNQTIDTINTLDSQLSALSKRLMSCHCPRLMNKFNAMMEQHFKTMRISPPVWPPKEERTVWEREKNTLLDRIATLEKDIATWKNFDMEYHRKYRTTENLLNRTKEKYEKTSEKYEKLQKTHRSTQNKVKKLETKIQRIDEFGLLRDLKFYVPYEQLVANHARRHRLVVVVKVLRKILLQNELKVFVKNLGRYLDDSDNDSDDSDTEEEVEMVVKEEVEEEEGEKDTLEFEDEPDTLKEPQSGSSEHKKAEKEIESSIDTLMEPPECKKRRVEEEEEKPDITKSNLVATPTQSTEENTTNELKNEFEQYFSANYPSITHFSTF